MKRRALLVVCLIGVFTVALPASAVGERPATKAEIRAIEASLDQQSQAGPFTFRFAWISTVAPGWAKVPAAVGDAPSLSLFHLKGTEWVGSEDGDVGPKGPFDEFCAFAPAAVVLDLFRTHCPSYRALHARRAPAATRAALLAALRTAPAIKAWAGPDASHVNLALPCVSRLDPHWAAGVAEAPDTGSLVWFHKIAGRWHVLVSWRTPYPPHGPVLSLASCVEYPAAVYGA